MALFKSPDLLSFKAGKCTTGQVKEIPKKDSQAKRIMVFSDPRKGKIIIQKDKQEVQITIGSEFDKILLR